MNRQQAAQSIRQRLTAIIDAPDIPSVCLALGDLRREVNRLTVWAALFWPPHVADPRHWSNN